MSQFRIHIGQDVRRYGTVVVEADSLREARNLIRQDVIDADDFSSVEWDGTEQSLEEPNGDGGTDIVGGENIENDSESFSGDPYYDEEE